MFSRPSRKGSQYKSTLWNHHIGDQFSDSLHTTFFGRVFLHILRMKARVVIQRWLLKKRESPFLFQSLRPATSSVSTSLSLLYTCLCYLSRDFTSFARGRKTDIPAFLYEDPFKSDFFWTANGNCSVGT